jgi:uncharacterized RDD family membrane protein YckC
MQATIPNSTPSPIARSAGALRQLGSAVYDGLLIGAVLMVATFIVLRLLGSDPMTSKAGMLALAVHRAILLAALAAYFGHGWTRRGQTLGMKAWKTVIIRSDGQPMRWRAAFLRLAVAAPLWLAAFTGMIWYMPSRQPLVLLLMVPQVVSLLMLLTPLNRTLPDLVSGTRIVRD